MRLVHKLLLYALLIVSLATCKSDRDGNRYGVDRLPLSKMSEVALTSKGTIYVYRYNGFSEKMTAAAIAELKRYYPRVEEAGELELPEWAKYKPKGCYTGSSILNQLRRTRKTDVVIGFTDKDVCYVNHGKEHYRCMGLGRAEQGVAIATTSRFKSKKNLQLYFNRLVLHELGHAFGLGHCKNKDCIMVAAYGKNQFGHTPSFCRNCQEYLKAKNWRFNL